MKQAVAYVVSLVGAASVVLAAFVLFLEVYRPRFRDIQMSTVLAINCGVAAIVLLLVHLALAGVLRWRNRETLWILVAWGVIGLAYWMSL